MAQVMPPGGAQSAQGAPPQEDPQGQQGGGDPQEALQDIQEGFMQLAQLMKQAQGQVDPNDMKLFEAAVQSFDAFQQSITGPAEQGPQKAPQSGPMPANANAGAKPMPNQG